MSEREWGWSIEVTVRRRLEAIPPVTLVMELEAFSGEVRRRVA